MSRGYKNLLLKELRDQQVRYAPREKKLEQLERAERLFFEIDTSRQYSYKYVCFRITDYKPEMHASQIISGEDAKHDISLFVEDMSNSIVLPIESTEETVWTIEQLSERFHVSTKTISRWRKLGLLGRRFLTDGKKRIGFLNTSVELFIQSDPERIKRGEQFSQLTEKERKAIILRARELSNTGGSPTEIAKRLSEHTGRSVETIRYTLKAFDESNTETALFPNRNSPLRDEIKRRIYQDFRRDEKIEDLAEKYNRTKGSIYRIIGQFRARRIMELPLDYIDSPDFAKAKIARKESAYLKSITRSPGKKTAARRRNAKNVGESNPQAGFSPETVDSNVFQETVETPSSDSLPPYLAKLYEVPLLTAEQETHLFRKMNYLKYKASLLRKRLSEEKPKARLMSQIETLYDLAVATKNEIISANLRLVVSIAKKHVGPFVNFFELVSDGNLSLIKAVEKFDYMRGNKFSTYATWAVMRNFARTIPDEKKYRDRFHPSENEIFESTEDFRSLGGLEEKIQSERVHLVDRLLEELSDREQEIIMSRYGLGNEQSPRTLRQIGAEMDVTKERVRQIEIRALAKLRKVAQEEHLEIPEG